MRRMRLIGVAVCAMLACAAAVSAADAPAKARPNVLFICVDDLKPVLGCYGDKVVKAPNVDRLAARGVVFDRAYCNQAVCAPSRNSLMTGLRPQTLGIYDLGTNFRKAAPDAVTMAQYFQRNGYRTEAMGKIFHVGHGNHEDPASWTIPIFKAKTVGYALPENKQTTTREEALFEGKDQAGLPRGAAYESADVPDEAYGDGNIANEAVKRLKAAKERPNEPFFMAVGFLKPHLPFCAPKKYWDLYDRSAFKLAEVKEPPVGAPSYAPQFGGELRNYKDMPGGKTPIPDDTQRTLIHGYYAATSYMDAQLGKVLDALDETGLAGNTIVVLWGDHGYHLGDHGMWNKHTNYEEAAKIPLIIVTPGGPKGVHSGAMVETVDVYPTLAELAGLPPREGLDGVSITGVLKDPAAAKGRPAITHVFPRGERLGRAIRTERYRLVEWKRIGDSPDKADLELYDYQEDPLERKNWAAERTDVVAALREILDKQPEAKPQWRPAAPRGEREALFKRKDTNGDGKLTRDEFMANQADPGPAAKRWEAFDTNKDGVLSEEEFVKMGRK